MLLALWAVPGLGQVNFSNGKKELPSAKQTSAVVLNQYAAVLQRTTNCDNGFIVDNASGFSVGDTVLMIQMKGATIDTSNTASFGSILSYNGAGNYEFNTIKSISGTKIMLRYQVKRQYDIPGGLVQLVRVPSYASYTVNQPHTCLPWNGKKGGVFAIIVGGSLTLNDNIDVSGSGFVGGLSNPIYRGTYLCNITAYYHPPNMDSSAQKGEGITTVGIGKTYARGSLANGGGGGNAANTGGGGGGNGGAGGIGGREILDCSNRPATNIIAGLGGLAQTYNATNNKLFMGGGGGAGQANEKVVSNGGAGGGIVLINAGSIIGNGNSILANGENAPECSAPTTDCNDDGTGGGGGGGVIAISGSSISSTLNLSAKGGKGANIYLVQPYLGWHDYHGPGGGGGGGVIWVSPAISSVLGGADVSGGLSGVHPQLSNYANGADPGNPGQTLSTLVLVAPVDTFRISPPSVDFTFSIISCNSVQFTAIAPSAISYQWNFGDGNSSNISNPMHTFPNAGTYSVTLTVTDGNGCTNSVTKQITVTPVSGHRSDTTICEGQAVEIHAFPGADTYSWAPGASLSNTTIYNPIATPTTTTMYVATVTMATGCVFYDTVVVHVSTKVSAGFDYSPNPPIANRPIQFNSYTSGAQHYAWSFGDGTGSAEEDPIHLYTRSGSFQVCLIVTNDACLDTVCKMIDATVHLVIAVPSAFSPNGDGTNDILFAHGAGVESFSLKIYNRWGQLVFETTDLNKGWDGTFKGQPQRIETYAYVLTATFLDGSHYQKTGNLSLIR